MNANELMIGDWVKIQEPDKYAGAIGRVNSLTSLEGGYFAINIQDPQFGYLVTEVFCDDIAPIPLTAGMLEKNGFVRFGTSYVLEGEHFGLENPSSPDDYKDNYWLRIGGKGHNILYVHQLQNALRLADINKEITI